MGYIYDTSAKTIQVTAASTARALHDDIQTTFAGSTYMQYLIPDSGSIKNALYILQNGWTFLDSTSIGYMNTGGWQDATGDNIWTNIQCISSNDFTGVQLYYNQTGTPVNFNSTGLVNCLLKVRDAGTDISSQIYTVYQREFQKKYSQFSTVASTGGVDFIPLYISDDPILTIASNILDSYTDLFITWGTVSKDVGDGTGAHDYNISIVTTDPSRSLVEIFNWVQYQLIKNEDIASGSETHIGKITDALVNMPSTSSMITMPGVWVEGFSSIDINNIVYTDVLGNTHSYPLLSILSITANVSLLGAEVRIYDLDTSDGTFGSELSGVESNTTSTYEYIGSRNNLVYVQIMKDGYVEYGQSLTLLSSSQVLSPVLVFDINK